MSSDPFSVIGGMFNNVVQQVEQNVENGLNTVMNTFDKGSSAGSGKGISGGGFINDAMDQFSLGGMFGANGEGFAGELFGSFMGDQFGILGGIFANHSDPTSAGNGYANPCGGDTGGAGSTGNTHGATPAGPQTLDPIIDKEIDALQTLLANFDKLSKNGTVTKADLQKAALDSSNPELQQAAKFFLANPDCMNQMMAGTGGNGVSWDRMYALEQGLEQTKAANGGTQVVDGPPAGGSSSTGGSTATGGSGSTGGSTATDGSGATGSTTSTTSTDGSNYRDFTDMITKLQQEIADLKKKGSGSTGGSSGGGGTSKSSSKEESLGKLDEQIGNYQSDIEKQMAILADPKSTDGQRQAAQTQIQLDTMNMQRDLDAIKQLFEMLSNMEKAYSDICMNAISNMR